MGWRWYLNLILRTTQSALTSLSQVTILQKNRISQEGPMKSLTRFGEATQSTTMGYLDDMEDDLVGWMPPPDEPSAVGTDQSSNSLPQPYRPSQSLHQPRSPVTNVDQKLQRPVQQHVQQPQWPDLAPADSYALPKLGNYDWNKFNHTTGPYSMPQAQALSPRRGATVALINTTPLGSSAPGEPQKKCSLASTIGRGAETSIS